jgi:phosphate starvation-inducible PhoH-like protein
MTKQVKLEFDNQEILNNVFGEYHNNVKVIEKRLGIKINTRGNQIFFNGDTFVVDLTEKLLHELYGLSKKNLPLFPGDIEQAIEVLSANRNANLAQIFLEKVYLTSRNKIIRPKSPNQKLYVEAIRNFDIVFAIGVAGTGKTYLAMAMAIQAFSSRNVKRLVLTRPAVEAGERLGFLPGDFKEKVNPYLRPLYDALYDMLDAEKVNEYQQNGVIEIAPLAFMRGRTLNDAFVVLDEAQNTTIEQMKMFLTRLGYGSKAVITGDITQIDLDKPKKSGLVHARSILSHIEGIKFCYFTEKDVVRHPLVQEIIKAYDSSPRLDKDSDICKDEE